MKLAIVGLPASGKTTLAKQLSQEHQIPLLELDQIFVQFDRGTNQRTRLLLEDVEGQIDDFMRQSGWIIEGIYPIESVLQQADTIIWLRPNLPTLIYRQWRRYATDPEQRRKYGFKNNVGLSLLIVAVRMNRRGVRVAHGRDVTHAQMQQMLHPHRHKTYHAPPNLPTHPYF